MAGLQNITSSLMLSNVLRYMGELISTRSEGAVCASHNASE